MSEWGGSGGGSGGGNEGVFGFRDIGCKAGQFFEVVQHAKDVVQLFGWVVVGQEKVDVVCVGVQKLKLVGDCLPRLDLFPSLFASCKKSTYLINDLKKGLVNNLTRAYHCKQMQECIFKFENLKRGIQTEQKCQNLYDPVTVKKTHLMQDEIPF